MAIRIAFIACFVCCTAIASAHTAGPVSLDFSPLGAAHSESTAGLAPADISFGVYPMSVIGIENTIRRYDGTTHLDDGPIAYAVLAIRAWEERFPHDPGIPRALLYLQRAYEHADTEEGAGYAQHVAAWLQVDYPATAAAQASRTELTK
jgi:hypothetical protein